MNFTDFEVDALEQRARFNGLDIGTCTKLIADLRKAREVAEHYGMVLEAISAGTYLPTDTNPPCMCAEAAEAGFVTGLGI